MDEVNEKLNILINAYNNLKELMDREESTPLRPAYYTAAIIENISNSVDDQVFL